MSIFIAERGTHPCPFSSGDCQEDPCSFSSGVCSVFVISCQFPRTLTCLLGRRVASGWVGGGGRGLCDGAVCIETVGSASCFPKLLLFKQNVFFPVSTPSLSQQLSFTLLKDKKKKNNNWI